MTSRALQWMRKVIYSLREQDYIYAIEEFSQPTFHIMVYRDYRTYVKNKTVLLAER
jgi:hypothetical protein